jgi:hypothetical protein
LLVLQILSLTASKDLLVLQILSLAINERFAVFALKNDFSFVKIKKTAWEKNNGNQKL